MIRGGGTDGAEEMAGAHCVTPKEISGVSASGSTCAEISGSAEGTFGNSHSRQLAQSPLSELSSVVLTGDACPTYDVTSQHDSGMLAVESWQPL
jgi:hypothetical protein